MSRAPAVIIIARHGARLDAEDESWIANSPAPYNSPLSYGGWIQTRALGGRIASLLHERDIALNDADVSKTRRVSEDIDVKFSRSAHEQPPSTTPRRRKHKVIIHSSPFLRCIQSSLAISAGMAQYQGNLSKFETKSSFSRNPRAHHLYTPSRSQTVDSTLFESKYASASSAQKAPLQSQSAPSVSQFMKPTLRIDACLGEWLSPDYFEFITAPPSSNMMVAGAKADLMRLATPIQGASSADDHSSSDPPPLDLDGRSAADAIADLSIKELPEACIGEVAPPNGTATTKEASVNPPSSPLPGSRHKSLSAGYVPPTPIYPISTTAAIPAGYVAHARDACIKLDLQWDSMRAPQEWGDGGEHGEEWSSMHRRFRKGLMNMITWYKNRGPYFDPQAEVDEALPEFVMDSDEDIILVIVTHGAGCNALIGAITNQPVLLDVGMASLTMAVRKDASLQAPDAAPRSPTLRRRSSVDVSQAAEYEMRLIASMDHLRAGRDPLKIPQLQSPRALASIPEANRRNGSLSSMSSGRSGHAESERAKNSSLGSVRRSRATTTGTARTLSNEHLKSPLVHSGLWGSRQFSANSIETGTLTEENEPVETDESHGATAAEQTSKSPETNESTPVQTLPTRSTSQRGLWGSGPRKQPARRWTVVEQHL